MAAPLIVRRRFPVATLYAASVVLLVFYSLRYPGFPPTIVLAVPLYTAVAAGFLWWAIPVPVVFLSAGFIVALRHGGTPLPDLIDGLLPHLALSTVAILLGALVRSRRAYAAEEAERRVIAERLRIARELHDTVAHAIATITVQSGTALHLLDSQPDRTGEALTAIRQTAKEALAEMRATLDVLRSGDESAVDRGAGLDRLPDLLAAVRAAGLEVDLNGEPAGQLTGPVDHAAYRILQESLTNVLRHAGPAARAKVLIRVEPTAVDIEISDDGTGLNGDSPTGHGLAGMRERAEALGGRLDAGPRPGGGFTVRARLPRETR
jgi:signal transduction histidine kinase